MAGIVRQLQLAGFPFSSSSHFLHDNQGMSQQKQAQLYVFLFTRAFDDN